MDKTIYVWIDTIPYIHEISRLIKDRQRTMPHPSQNEHSSKKASAEVISPLSIQGSRRGQDRLRPERRRLRKVSLLGLALIAVLALGGWLLHYLKSRPHYCRTGYPAGCRR